MAAKDIPFSRDARESIARGVDLMADAVRVMLRPKGRNVVIDKGHGAPHITKGASPSPRQSISGPIREPEGADASCSRYYSLGASEERLREAVSAVGNSADNVRAYLKNDS